jgi:hypothetical protein
MELSKFQNIKENQFNSGYEVEACFYREGFKGFVEKIKKLDKRINIGTDGSIRPIGWRKSDRYGRYFGHIGREIKTPVLKTIEGIQLLNEVFKLVSDFGYTNSTCSCHLNFSPIDKKDYERVNPFFLVQQDFWKRIRRHFDRDGNKYCQDIFLRKDIRENPANILKKKFPFYTFWDGYRDEEVNTEYKHKNAISLWRYLISMQDFKKFGNQQLVRCHFHYAGINFENFKPLPTKESRIEIRGVGNTDYEKRLDEIVPYIDESLFWIKESYKHEIKI